MPAKFCQDGCQGCPGGEERTKSQQYNAARLQAQAREDGQLQQIRQRIEMLRQSSLASSALYVQDAGWLLEQLELAREEIRMLRQGQQLQARECTQPDQTVHTPAGEQFIKDLAELGSRREQ